MLRLLIADITLEKLPQTRQIVLHIRWLAGACSDVTVQLPLPIAERRRYPTKTIEQIRQLACNLSDEQIAQRLNDEGLHDMTGSAFTHQKIRSIRCRYKVPARRQQRPDELTLPDLAARLGVGRHFIRYWIKQGVIPARKAGLRGGWLVTLNDKLLHDLKERMPTLKTIAAPQSDNSTLRSAV